MNNKLLLMIVLYLGAMGSLVFGQNWGHFTGWEHQTSGYRESCNWGGEGNLECTGDGCQWVDINMDPCMTPGTDCSQDGWDEVYGEWVPCTSNCDCDYGT
jgi:hypothetical protein